MTLPKSPVVFVDEVHRYHLGDRRLSGITGLIHECLQLGVYPDANDYVKSFFIPRAAEYGKSVHMAIEDYDTLGVRCTHYPKSRRFQDGDGDEFWDVSRELDSYIANKQGYQSVANEYTVSDEERYASQIDNVWLKEETGGIWLVDTKSNNVELYPGRTAGLKEYLSWQLSCYAFLFERQTGLKVEGLACNWLRKGESRFWIIDRQPDEDVEKLLSTPWVEIDGRIVYDVANGQAILDSRSAAVVEAPAQSLMPQEVIESIYSLLKAKADAEEKVAMLREELQAAMEASNIKSWTCDRFKATISAESTTTTLDARRLKAERPDIYNEYSKKTTKKASLTIKLAEEKSNQ